MDSESDFRQEDASPVSSKKSKKSQIGDLGYDSATRLRGNDTVWVLDDLAMS